MAPQKRKKANVQEILKNPVNSKQPLLRLKKEGIWGWLSYLGYIFSVVFVPLWIINSFCTYAGILNFPLYSFHIINIVCISFGLILTGITIWKSPYNLSKKAKIILFENIVIFSLLLEFLAYDLEWEMLPFNILLGLTILWLFLLFWYMHYFYKKSKDGYHRVWLKVILFTIIPILPLLWWRWEYDNPYVISNVMYVGDDYPYYEGY